MGERMSAAEAFAERKQSAEALAEKQRRLAELEKLERRGTPAQRERAKKIRFRILRGEAEKIEK